ncbi:MAG: 16S rRNA (uracil(1498)-N(3))-methyltransferase [Oligoflexia bacterium]|nr:16S rRNA (uracil(1498)-N(3))-methyltransferase [Oligoflexia bacterium]
MNSLLIFPEELLENNQVVLKGDRAEHAVSTHKLSTGARVRAALVNVGRGEAHVDSIARDQVRLSYHNLLPPLNARPLDFLVAVSRPQTVKKVLQFAAMTGVRSVQFVRAERSEKSYLDSGVWEEKQLRRELALGIEQSYDCRLPEIGLHRRFLPFAEDVLPNFLRERQAQLLVADTQHSQRSPLVDLSPRLSKSFVIAIGPELGWNEFELGLFLKQEALLVDLGPRILRTETALAVLSSQVEVIEAFKRTAFYRVPGEGSRLATKS